MAPRSTSVLEHPTTPTVTARQWKCEETPELRLYLANCSARPTARALGLAPEDRDRHRRGDDFIEVYAEFHGGKFVTSDPDVAAELERLEAAGVAPIYEDYGADVFTCKAHGFAHTNVKAWEAHLRVHHKEGSAPLLLDVANDDLGVEAETEY